MSLDYDLKIVAGVRVPYDKVWGVTRSLKYKCDHEFDRSKLKFCPECGTKNEQEIDEDYKFILPVPQDAIPQDMKEYWANRGGAESVFVSEEHTIAYKGYEIGVYHNFGDERLDHVIGMVVWYQDDIHNEVTKIDSSKWLELDASAKLVDAILKTWPDVSFDKDSFGLYIIQSCW